MEGFMAHFGLKTSSHSRDSSQNPANVSSPEEATVSCDSSKFACNTMPKTKAAPCKAFIPAFALEFDGLEFFETIIPACRY